LPSLTNVSDPGPGDEALDADQVAAALDQGTGLR